MPKCLICVRTFQALPFFRGLCKLWVCSLFGRRQETLVLWIRRRPLTWKIHLMSLAFFPCYRRTTWLQETVRLGKVQVHSSVLLPGHQVRPSLSTPEAFDKSFWQNEYQILSNAIKNTTNQKARNLLHILRYATGSIPRKNPGVPRGLQIFPAERSTSTYLYFLIFF